MALLDKTKPSEEGHALTSWGGSLKVGNANNPERSITPSGSKFNLVQVIRRSFARFGALTRIFLHIITRFRPARHLKLKNSVKTEDVEGSTMDGGILGLEHLNTVENNTDNVSARGR